MTAPLKGWIVKSQKLQREVKPQQEFIAKGLMKWHFPIKGEKDYFEKIRIIFWASRKEYRCISRDPLKDTKYFI